MSSIANAIVAAAQAAGIDPKLALEVANAESGMNQAARGSAGEIGVFQLLPSSFPGVDATDVNQNISAGVGYLAALLAKYQDPAAALAAYNWGSGSPQNPRLDAALARYGSDWFSHIPSSTQGYINKILANVQTQYAASVGPIPMPPAFMPGASQAGFIPPIAPPRTGMSVLTQVAITVAVIFGISMLLSEN
jgi:soluble lytic murein transglycosylase-like protein